MAIMKCPEDGCDRQVSTTADFCPGCGFKLQDFLKEELEATSVGVPVSPVEYWNNWHFWYWWGCRTDPSQRITYSEAGWVTAGDTLFSINGIRIRSPFSGLVVDRNHRRNDVAVSPLYSCEHFVELRIRKGTFHEKIGSIYDDVLGYIERAADGRRPNVFWALMSRIVGMDRPNDTLGLDPKRKFTSLDELLRWARDLDNIRAIRL